MQITLRLLSSSLGNTVLLHTLFLEYETQIGHKKKLDNVFQSNCSSHAELLTNLRKIEKRPKIRHKAVMHPALQLGGFLIPQNKIDQLIAYKHLLTNKQKKDIINSLQSGGQLVVKPTKSKYGGFLGTVLASIGIPLAIEAIKKITGKGAPRMGSDSIKGHGAPRLGMYQPPPFIGTWEQVRKGGGKKKTSQKNKKVRSRTIAREKQSIQKCPLS